jgi:hypothetical protein
VLAPSPVTLQAPGRALTVQDVAALRARRSELSNQLQSADGRRRRLSEQLDGSSGAARAGLEQRIMVLDQRIVQLESDIAETGRLLTESPTGLVASTTAARSFGGLTPQNVTTLGGAFTLFVLSPLAFAAARLMWKRASSPPAPRALVEAAARLGNLEQAVDAIAIEVERVSEGQRFVTRLLSEANGQAVPALGVGQPVAEPIRVGHEDAVRVPRRGT